MDSSPLNIILSVIFYFSVGVLTLFALFGIFVLIRYAKSLTAALAVSLLFSIFYLTILGNAYNTFLSIIK